MNATEAFLTVLIWIIGAFALVAFIVAAKYNFDNRQLSPERAFCQDDLKYGRTIHYCNGYPFTCNNVKCFYVTAYEQSYQSGKIIEYEVIPLEQRQP
jgi:hypothetical protein